ncbi:MAG: rRNA maturation RNase YbeY [Flavobacteriales bacterium]|nr:rRNA maturation RNase YbeY [Flavobacteriales bacterium]
MKPTILFFNADSPYTLLQKRKIKTWIIDCANKENKRVGEVNIIFCTDEYLLEMNRSHLDHDFYTDIITFDSSTKSEINGELYISVDRVKDNAKTHNAKFVDEMHRVIIHGFLHLMGYKDKKPSEEKQMRLKEDFCLNLRSF